jgi:hypothetical protein
VLSNINAFPIDKSARPTFAVLDPKRYYILSICAGP